MSSDYESRRPRIGIAIVNWNAGTQLVDCVDSLLSSSSFGDLDVVVVDNASEDGSMDALIGKAGVKTIFSESNLGFGCACNLAAKNLSNEFILFLNPDAGVYEKTLECVIAFMDSPAGLRTGICGVQLLDEHDRVARSCARLPTASSFFYQALGISKLRRFQALGSRMADWDHASSQRVDQLIGAFFFVRRNVFDELNGFDERFFVYFEEVDFSLRAKKLGWESFYLSTTQAFHSGGGSSDQVKAKRLFYSLRSRLLYSFKNFSRLDALVVLLSTLFLEPISRSVLAASRLSWRPVKETWAGYAMLLKWLSSKPSRRIGR